MTTIREAAEQLATTLKTSDVFATADPKVAVNNRPCLLVDPPVLDYTTTGGGASATWTIAALSDRQVGDLGALDDIAPLIDRAADVLHVETARPSLYRLSTELPPVPAYLLTVTT